MPIKLPDFQFDPAEEKQKLREFWQQLTGVFPLPSYPEDFILDVLVYFKALQLAEMERKALSNFVEYAEGEDLDRLAKNFYGIERLPAQPAQTVIRFYTNADITLQPGIKVATKDLKVVFETKELYQTGEGYQDWIAYATEAGSFGNGYLPGEISVLLEPIAGITKVENIVVTTGGTDVEDDDHFRERVLLSFERLPATGTKYGYVFHTKSAHPNVGSVSVRSPEAGKVEVRFLLRDGSLPDTTMIETVRKYLYQDKVKNLTDYVEVLPPEVVNANLSVQVFVKDIALKTFVENTVREKLQTYADTVGKTIGMDLICSKVIDLCFVHPTVAKVEVLEPSEDIVVDETKVVKVQNLSVEVVQYEG
jgi:phage-related baseplate assembly protein